MDAIYDYIAQRYDTCAITINDFPFLNRGKVVACIETGESFLVYYDESNAQFCEIHEGGEIK